MKTVIVLKIVVFYCGYCNYYDILATLVIVINMGAISFCGYNGPYNCRLHYWLLWLPDFRSGASISSTSQVRVSDILLLQTIGI